MNTPLPPHPMPRVMQGGELSSAPRPSPGGRGSLGSLQSPAGGTWRAVPMGRTETLFQLQFLH